MEFKTRKELVFSKATLIHNMYMTLHVMNTYSSCGPGAFGCKSNAAVVCIEKTRAARSARAPPSLRPPPAAATYCAEDKQYS